MQGAQVVSGNKLKISISFSIILLIKPKGKRPFGRLQHRWEDGIRMDLTEIGWGSEVDSAG
jgi:hypothetical protein